MLYCRRVERTGDARSNASRSSLCALQFRLHHTPAGHSTHTRSHKPEIHALLYAVTIPQSLCVPLDQRILTTYKMSTIVKTRLKASREAIGKKDFEKARDDSLKVLEFDPENYNAYGPIVS